MREDRQRLDKWLWFARLTKTRSLAAKLIADGYVRLNGRRAEAVAQPLAPGDVITVAASHRTLVLRVAALGVRRGPAPEARLLYDEIDRDDGALVRREGSG